MNPHEIPSTTVDQLPDPLPADLVVLDVREDHEWEAGHVEGAVHVPLAQVPERAGELDPQKRTLVVCHLGGRSARATAYLQQLGHDVINLDGGMDAWQAAGRPTV
ncbi:rhodanese-like domain-containing protein [Aeromicrobium massiliense]|uniref:rhodanese-like domain-containing protein n=1 Tax=Aeromicrobium massiliense TaxID=1464554 RepID=UPI0028FCB57F|nr:rhodanese-like domain-containing protein [Aeromicrobium massiliense]